MTLAAFHSSPCYLSRAGLGLLTMVLLACGTADKRADSIATASSAPAAMPDSAMMAKGGGAAGAQMGQMATMTGDPDHDFLRMMSDHHKGLIALLHMAKDRKEGGAAVADAKKLDDAQDKELDQMMTMLEKEYKDPYAPKVTPEHQAMADELKTRSGVAYDRTFYQSVITNHQEALTMIEGYLPKARNPALKRMAETMKANQTREISVFEQKVSTLGA